MKERGLVLFLSLATLTADRFLKVLVEQPYFSSHFGWPLLAFERFHNLGIAFGIPVRASIAVPVALIFLAALAITIRGPRRIWLVPIFFGALSNIFDRATLGVTVDYLRILYSIINLADVLVAVGLLGLVFSKD